MCCEYGGTGAHQGSSGREEVRLLVGAFMVYSREMIRLAPVSILVPAEGIALPGRLVAAQKQAEL